MSVFKVHPPFPVFIDNNSEHLDGGKIYIGEAGKNPIAFPLQVWLDNELTIPASQPLRTSKGMLIGPNGQPTAFYLGLNEYSIAVYSASDQYINGDLDVSVYQYDETGTPRTYDFAFWNPGTPAGGGTEFVVVTTPRDFSFLAGVSDKYASAVIAPSNDVTYTVKKNGVSIGTIYFAAASTTGVWTFASLVSFVAGDVLSITSPANTYSMQGMAVTMAAERY